MDLLNNEYKVWDEDPLFKAHLTLTYGCDNIPFTGDDILNFLRIYNPKQMYSHLSKLYRIGIKSILVNLQYILRDFCDDDHCLSDVLKPDYRFVVESYRKFTVFHPDELFTFLIEISA